MCLFEHCDYSSSCAVNSVFCLNTTKKGTTCAHIKHSVACVHWV